MDNLDYLLSSFRDRMEMLSNAMSVGNCGSYDEYKFMTGQVRGLMAACAIVEDLKSNLEISDD